MSRCITYTYIYRWLCGLHRCVRGPTARAVARGVMDDDSGHLFFVCFLFCFLFCFVLFCFVLLCFILFLICLCFFPVCRSRGASTSPIRWRESAESVVVLYLHELTQPDAGIPRWVAVHPAPRLIAPSMAPPSSLADRPQSWSTIRSLRAPIHLRPDGFPARQPHCISSFCFVFSPHNGRPTRDTRMLAGRAQPVTGREVPPPSFLLPVSFFPARPRRRNAPHTHGRGLFPMYHTLYASNQHPRDLTSLRIFRPCPFVIFLALRFEADQH